MIKNLLQRIITSIFLIIVLFFALFHSELSWKILVIIFLLMCFYEFYNLIKKINLNKYLSTGLIFLITMYLYFFYYFSIKIRLDFGKEFILILLVTCIFSDIGGYVFGKLIGGPKLTNISPNKTISGSIGSILFTIFGTILFLNAIDNIYQAPIILEFSLKICTWLIMMSIFCQLGDLFVSYLKRKAKVKDTGILLPGHGGILDRVDGIILALPLGFLTFFL